MPIQTKGALGVTFGGQFKKLTEDNQQLKEQLKKQANRADNLVVERDEARSSKRNLELQNQRFIENAQRTKEVLVAANEEVLTFQAVRERHAVEVRELTERVGSLEALVADLETRNRDAHDVNATLERQLQEYQSMLLAERKKSDSDEQELRTLRSERSVLDSNRATLRKANDQKGAEIAKLNRAKDKIFRELSSARATVAGLERKARISEKMAAKIMQDPQKQTGSEKLQPAAESSAASNCGRSVAGSASARPKTVSEELFLRLKRELVSSQKEAFQLKKALERERSLREAMICNSAS